jgi:hypothetical protein
MKCNPFHMQNYSYQSENHRSRRPNPRKLLSKTKWKSVRFFNSIHYFRRQQTAYRMVFELLNKIFYFTRLDTRPSSIVHQHPIVVLGKRA